MAAPVRWLCRLNHDQRISVWIAVVGKHFDHDRPTDNGGSCVGDDDRGPVRIDVVDDLDENRATDEVTISVIDHVLERQRTRRTCSGRDGKPFALDLNGQSFRQRARDVDRQCVAVRIFVIHQHRKYRFDTAAQSDGVRPNDRGAVLVADAGDLDTHVDVVAHCTVRIDWTIREQGNSFEAVERRKYQCAKARWPDGFSHFAQVSRYGERIDL